MRILDFYTLQGTYAPGETVTFFIDLEIASEDITLGIFIRHLNDQPISIEQTLFLPQGNQTIQVQWIPPAKPAGYSVQVEISSATDTVEATTAFDLLSSWADFPRYGFLTDFSASRADPEMTLQNLTRFHVNGLQFYDWQYRHDQLLAPVEEYIDPLGRELSLASVRKLLDAAHRHGMAAMPYLAIYAASARFWLAHPDLALYDEAGKPIAFGENFLGLMNPSAGSPWSVHLLAEGTRALEVLPFDGLHIDQYGDPKQAWDSRGNPVDLPKAFVDFIQSASDRHPDKTILFNAVGNWPVDELAQSAADFMYIEVWPPNVEYRQLAEIVLNAVHLSHGKAVVIALYLPANRPANNLLADAVILACGGTRIELGEEARLLSDPYFPKHEEISPELRAKLREFYDFMVCNGEWLRPYTLSLADKEKWADGELNPDYISTEGSIMTVLRNQPQKTIVQLVNFTSLGSDARWNEEHGAPTLLRNVTLRMARSQRPTQILWNCPAQIKAPQVLDFEFSNGMLNFQIPQIDYTGLIVIHD